MTRSIYQKCWIFRGALEYFYSMYVIFSILSLTSFMFPVLVIINATNSHFGFADLITLSISPKMFIFDIFLFIVSLFSAIHARRFKEHLRMKLLNSCRTHSIELIAHWFQHELPEETTGSGVI